MIPGAETKAALLQLTRDPTPAVRGVAVVSLGDCGTGALWEAGLRGFPKDEEKHVLFFPTLTSVFLFLVLYPLLPPALLPHHSLTHLTHTHSSHSHIHTLTHSLTHSLTPSLPRSLARSLTLQAVGCTPWRLQCLGGSRGTMCTAKGSRGTMRTAKESDVQPGVRLASLDLHLFCVAGVGQCALPRGRMYALGFGWRPWVSASFAWQARGNVHCQGVGCTPWGSAGAPGSPPLLCGRCGTMCTFAWQAWDNVHYQGDNVHCWWLLRGRRGTLCSHSFTLTHSLSLMSSLTHSLNHSYTHSLTHSLTRSLAHSLTLSLSLTHHSLTFSFTHLCMHIHTHIHKNSPTIIPPSLFYFLFPSCFSMLSLSLEKLVTCGVIWSYNF